MLAPTAVEYEPAAQLWQVLESFAPTAIEKRPGTQATHVVNAFAPGTVEYFPATHGVHELESELEPVPLYPGLHLQSLEDVQHA